MFEVSRGARIPKYSATLTPTGCRLPDDRICRTSNGSHSAIRLLKTCSARPDASRPKSVEPQEVESPLPKQKAFERSSTPALRLSPLRSCHRRCVSSFAMVLSHSQPATPSFARRRRSKVATSSRKLHKTAELQNSCKTSGPGRGSDSFPETSLGRWNQQHGYALSLFVFMCVRCHCAC